MEGLQDTGHHLSDFILYSVFLDPSSPATLSRTQQIYSGLYLFQGLCNFLFPLLGFLSPPQLMLGDPFLPSGLYADVSFSVRISLAPPCAHAHLYPLALVTIYDILGYLVSGLSLLPRCFQKVRDLKKTNCFVSCYIFSICFMAGRCPSRGLKLLGIQKAPPPPWVFFFFFFFHKITRELWLVLS